MAGRNQVRGDVDATNPGASPRGWQGGCPVAATKIEDVHPGANIQCGDERVSAVPHGCGEAGEIALLPQCPVRVDRRICHGQNLSFSKATVQFVAIVNRSPVVIGISTAGAAPVLGQAIRRRIETLRSEEHTSETPVTNAHLVCRLLLAKKKT